ncbi:signal peptidase II [Nocardia sp. JMUB6875]
MGRVSTDRPRESGAEEPDIAAEPETSSESEDAASSKAESKAAEAVSKETVASQPLRLRNLLVIAAVVLGLDLLTKTIVVATMTPGKPIYLIGDWARLTLVRNPGAAFSMATGMTWLLTLVAAAVVIGVIRIGRTLRSLPWAIGLGMVLGGALGNLIDRLFRAPGPLQGHVVDFVAVGWWPVFNVADSSIVCGAILLVALTVFGFEPDGSRMHREHATSAKGETA